MTTTSRADDFARAAGDPLQVAGLIGAAFRLYRMIAAEHIRKDLSGKSEPTAADLIRSAQVAYSAFLPKWLSTLVPVVTTGLTWSSRETGYLLQPEILEELATGYSSRLTGQLNETTIDAAVKGFNALVNRKIPAKLALANILDAYGITNKSVKTLVMILTGNEKSRLSELVLPSVKKMRARRYIESAITDRTTVIGEHEAWNLREQGKLLAWVVAQRKGLISPSSVKVWETAEDERVCPVCGPLQGRRQSIDQPFDSGDGKIWSPPVHVNCRCSLRLRERRMEVVKSWDPKEHPRDKRGEFTNKPTAYQEIDLQRAVDEARLRVALGGRTTEEHNTARLQAVPTLPKSKLTPSLTPRLTRASLTRPKLRSGSEITHPAPAMTVARLSRPKPPLHRAPELRQMARNAQLRAGNLHNRLSDVPGQIVSGTDKTDLSGDRYAGYTRTPTPMYAVIDNESIAWNEPNTIRFNGNEVTSDPELLMDRIHEHQVRLDTEYVKNWWQNRDAYIILGNETYLIEDEALLDTLAWERETMDSIYQVSEPDIRVVREERYWTNSGKAFSPKDYYDFVNREDDLKDLEDNDTVQTRLVEAHLPASVISDSYDLGDYVEETKVELVEVQVVPEDGFYTTEHLEGPEYHANLDGMYRTTRNSYLDAAEVTDHGVIRSYQVYRVEPDESE